ncbi:hypothetical protein AAKU55_004245 [Oxalobacteraceae bacterium GrIS 1.11]
MSFGKLFCLFHQKAGRMMDEFAREISCNQQIEAQTAARWRSEVMVRPHPF